MYPDTHQQMSPLKRRIVRKLLGVPADERGRLLQLEALRRGLTPPTNSKPELHREQPQPPSGGAAARSD